MSWIKKIARYILKDELKSVWTNPFNWPSCNPEYLTIDKLQVPPNTFITINDRDIKKWLIKNKFHTLEFEELIWKLESAIYRYIKYTKDKSFFDDWRTASYTFKNKKGDCDNKAILFQTCMHMLGYGDKCIVKTARCILGDFDGGHAYNKVLVENNWIIVDPTNPKEFRTDDWKYDLPMKKLGWFFNYWNTYKEV